MTKEVPMLRWLLTAAMSLTLATLATAADPPRVLIIGDSISIGYTPAVKELLKGKADVTHHPGNAQDTRNGLARLDQWLGDTKWDLIHFNWGLWDLRREAGPFDVPPEQYEKNLRELVKRLKKTNARLVWASITPVTEPNQRKRRDEDVRTYNAIAKKVMEEEGIAIDDLYAIAKGREQELIVKDGVHFTKDGYGVLGKAVAEAIEKALAR
jgi:lysophospholipase L1-like esterase